MSTRMKDAAKLLKSKCYILITDKEGTMAGDFKGFSGIMKIHTLKAMHTQTERLLNKLQAKDTRLVKPKAKPKKKGG